MDADFAADDRKGESTPSDLSNCAGALVNVPLVALQSIKCYAA